MNVKNDNNNNTINIQQTINQYKHQLQRKKQSQAPPKMKENIIIQTIWLFPSKIPNNNDGNSQDEITCQSRYA